jgi:hypothetical protein
MLSAWTGAFAVETYLQAKLIDVAVPAEKHSGAHKPRATVGMKPLRHRCAFELILIFLPVNISVHVVRWSAGSSAAQSPDAAPMLVLTNRHRQTDAPTPLRAW